MRAYLWSCYTSRHFDDPPTVDQRFSYNKRRSSYLEMIMSLFWHIKELLHCRLLFHARCHRDGNQRTAMKTSRRSPRRAGDSPEDASLKINTAIWSRGVQMARIVQAGRTNMRERNMKK